MCLSKVLCNTEALEQSKTGGFRVDKGSARLVILNIIALWQCPDIMAFVQNYQLTLMCRCMKYGDSERNLELWSGPWPVEICLQKSCFIFKLSTSRLVACNGFTNHNAKYWQKQTNKKYHIPSTSPVCNSPGIDPKPWDNYVSLPAQAATLPKSC